MHNCQGCHRPTGRGWIVCGWCGANQLARAPKKGFFSRIAGYILLLQAMGVVAASVTLAVAWAQSGWSVERAQLLGVIWLGVIIVLAFLLQLLFPLLLRMWDSSWLAQVQTRAS